MLSKLDPTQQARLIQHRRLHVQYILFLQTVCSSLIRTQKDSEHAAFSPTDKRDRRRLGGGEDCYGHAACIN